MHWARSTSAEQLIAVFGPERALAHVTDLLRRAVRAGDDQTAALLDGLLQGIEVAT
ncbi:hypothetical protein AB2M62_12740 [Sphingomonas sp. MMS12-HWE2-04]|uniref:hypothetical protein n=1 Tax=Sphingomonas sp. MMS12-HWE2-04 TaxID=3234199 RepID=UPI00384B05A5